MYHNCASCRSYPLVVAQLFSLRDARFSLFRSSQMESVCRPAAMPTPSSDRVRAPQNWGHSSTIS